MKNLTWRNPEQLFVAQELINKVKSKCCGIKDTIILKDTVFKDEGIDIDTLLSDEWYSINVGLRYPSSITVTPKFKSEKAVIVSAKKETVNPPKRFFLFRWFQKKHIVLHVNVIERNPYIEDQDNRYVEIVK